MELDKSALTKIPTHVAIIMDGNGRWARARGMPPVFGNAPWPPVLTAPAKRRPSILTFVFGNPDTTG